MERLEMSSGSGETSPPFVIVEYFIVIFRERGWVDAVVPVVEGEIYV